jgi:ABC-2 type transport system permease protein
MAGLTSPPTQRWTSAQSRAQFAALAQLRWCLFRNGFRRKGGTGELAARILLIPFLGILAAGPVLGAGIAGYYIVSSAQFSKLPALTWSIFALWQLVSINISAPQLSFDIASILRFPISFPRYLTARLVFGLLSAANVIGTLALLSADVGIGIARPSLLSWATLLLALFAAANIFFTRMIFAWIDRWLSTRRARELLTAFILFASLGFEYLNVTFNPGMQSGRHHHASHLPALLKILHRIEPIAALLPPGLTASSILGFAQSRYLPAIASLCGLIAFAALFLSIYAWRMHREFSGENLGELITQPAASTWSARPAARPDLQTYSPTSRTFGFSSVLAACLQKELLYLRRNTNQLFGFLAPVFMIFLFAGRISASGSLGSLVFPASVAYSILGVAVLSYNSLGMDGPGVQLYFLAPTRLRDVFLAKNLLGFLLNLIELILIYAVICFTGRSPSLPITIATVCWLLFAAFTSAAIGNLRSLTAPRKIDFSKLSRKQTSQFSALIALAVVAACCCIGFGVVVLASHLNHPWLMVPILLGLAGIAFVSYLRTLNRLDTIALIHREAITEELCRT